MACHNTGDHYDHADIDDNTVMVTSASDESVY